MRDLVKELEDLEAQATPDPWWYDGSFGAEVESSHVTVAGTEHKLADGEVFNALTGLADRDVEVCITNAKFIALMRNSLPKLLEAVKAARLVREHNPSGNYINILGSALDGLYTTEE